jgi:hypothetical protein
MVSVWSVKKGKSHSLIGGISVAVKSAKGEIRVSENQTLGLRRCPITRNLYFWVSFLFKKQLSILKKPTF